MSDDLQNAIAPLARFDDEQGVELFYNAAVTPWLGVALDLQYVNPATGSSDNAFVAGVRMRIRL